MNKNLQRLAVIGLVAVFSVASFFFGRQSMAQGNEPGTPADPIVSKSYVDTNFASKDYVDTTFAKKSDGGGTATLQAVELKTGQTLTAEAGTELIMRSGKAVVITSTDGIPDITGGKDLTRGLSAPLNHLLIVPRSDGRGIRALADSWVMVRGAFTIK